MEYVLGALLIILLGAAYVKGYDLVKSHSPGHLPHFYLIMTTVRMLLVITAIGIYAFYSDSRDNTIHFGLTMLAMYALMMVTTLTLRH